MATGTNPSMSQVDPLALAMGYQAWVAHPAIATGINAGALTSQKIYVTAMWLPAGVVVSGLVLDVTVAGVGAGVPTGFFVGICDTATMRQQSGDLHASALLLSTGRKQFAFTASYTTAVAGVYYGVVLENGAFSTPVQFARFSSQSVVGALTGQTAIGFGNIGTAQTALPANAAAVSLATDTFAVAMALY